MAAKYLDFCIMPRDPKKKTDSWEVRNKEYNTLLGVVKWHGAWRKYSFFVNGDFIFEEDCLTDIARFLKMQTKLYRDNKKTEKI